MIDDLIRNFEAELPQRLAELQAAWPGVGAGKPDALTTILRIAHSLAGAAGSFGYSEIASTAAAVEEAVRTLADPATDVAGRERLHQRLNHLGTQLAQPRRTTKPRTLPETPAKKSAHNKLIYLVDDNLGFCRMMAAEIAHFGFDVQGISRLEILPTLLEQALPDAIIMDVLFPEDPLAGPKAIEKVRAMLPPEIPIIFMSADTSITTRLAAVRAGGQAFFAKPFDVTELIDTLDQLLLTEPQEAYRILIIEDSPALAQLYAETLRTAGMETAIVTDPMRLLAAMHEFRPDLLLMDIYMPGVNGVELARVVRQNHAYFGIPIVYLSAESDPLKQFAALGEGADDFLVKPVDPQRLVNAVSTRAARYQAMRAQMVKDSLTGLLNHSNVLNRLDHELHRALRIKKPLSVAMIDIDHFKQVNDTHGHAVGDHVILTLARLLKERLRNSDAIGRYGGEEFAIVMPDTPLDQARQVIEGLRESFANLPQHAGLKTFRSTFSAGVAAANSDVFDRGVIVRADQALYAAKHQGRNRVVAEDEALPEAG